MARRWRRYRILKELGWTLKEYNEAPASLITEIWGFLTTENKAMADNMKEK